MYWSLLNEVVDSQKRYLVMIGFLSVLNITQAGSGYVHLHSSLLVATKWTAILGFVLITEVIQAKINPVLFCRGMTTCATVWKLKSLQL